MRTLFLVAVLALHASAGRAEILTIEIAKRSDLLGGRSFGRVGGYEVLEGRILFGLDPANPANRRIVDLGLAPRNAAGLVEFWANFAALVPKRPRPAGVALFEVSNRGLVYLRNILDFGTMTPIPATEADLGDAMLLEMGLTLVWVGWQHDVPDEPGRFRIEAPVATGLDGTPLVGPVRADWVVQRPTASLSLAHGGAIAYPTIDLDDPTAVLTVREGRYDSTRVVPRSEWRFGRVGEEGQVGPDPRWISRNGGFEPGSIYQLVYRARDPKVAGVGLAAIRDAMSHAKYRPNSPFAARYAVAFGISQTGRLLRHFLYQGFNTDERGRQVFDGMLIHVAGAGRGSFNHRFAQPSRDAHRFDTFFFPTDLFPFASGSATDPETGRVDGLTAGGRQLPKIFQTNSGHEYWGRAASLIHTTPAGDRDLAIPPNERIYLLAGSQHVPASFPPAEQTRHPESRAYRGNPVDYRLPLRSLLVSLVDWVRRGTAPPPSAYPRLDRGDLVPIDRSSWRLPRDLAPPRVVHQPDRVDYGARWAEGIIDREPPAVGRPFPARVPATDSLGNEVGGFRTVELEAPLATHPTWNTRVGQPGDQGELSRLLGTWLPLPKTEAERAATADPRPLVGSLYRDRQAFERRVSEALTRLIAGRMLLPADSARARRRAMATWEWLESR
ncbi:MAG: hypothetical protein FJ206_04810 [Gemmatimonadetes bacterium]|nr:hypothetical protein [Gemmatimonadota bacterium]